MTATPLEEGTTSLVVAVRGQAVHLERLLESLVSQGDVSLQVIVVDQNEDDGLQARLDRFKGRLAITRVKSAPGVSVARNAGLALAQGDVIAFPDDDCWYPLGLVRAVRQRLDENAQYAALTCRCTDEAGRLAAGGNGRVSGFVGKGSVWHRGVSATMFVRRGTIDRVGGFDPTLGLGACTPYQSGEETDVLLRIMQAGLVVYYEAALRVYHPLPPDPSSAGAILRAWSYGLGMGKVLRKHGYSQLQAMLYIVRPGVGAGLAWARGDQSLARLRAARAIGRFQGWRGSEPIHAPGWIADAGLEMEAARC